MTGRRGARAEILVTSFQTHGNLELLPARTTVHPATAACVEVETRSPAVGSVDIGLGLPDLEDDRATEGTILKQGQALCSAALSSVPTHEVVEGGMCVVPSAWTHRHVRDASDRWIKRIISSWRQRHVDEDRVQVAGKRAGDQAGIAREIAGFRMKRSLTALALESSSVCQKVMGNMRPVSRFTIVNMPREPGHERMSGADV